MNINRLDIESVRRVPRVTRLITHPPLRLLQTTGSPNTVEIYSGTYGGGMLQGDTVRLDLQCGADARLCLRSQGNTHIYKNTEHVPTVQIVNGTIETRGTVLVCPHPTILHEGALYHQRQHWHLQNDATVVLMEWMQSGRSESGERFKFREYRSHLTFSVNDQTVCEEMMRCRPDQDNPRSPVRFCGLDHALTVYLLGPAVDKLVTHLKGFTNTQLHSPATLPATENDAPEGPFYSLSPMPLCQGFIFRALARTSNDLKPVVTLISQFAESSSALPD